MSLLVLSIGVIGVAGLQVLGVSNSRDAYYRTQAVLLSYDIADRMRANLEAVEDGDYDAASGSEKTACRTTSGCSAADMAADDLFLWQQAIAQKLPGGAAIVCVDSDLGDDSNIAAAGDCDGTGDQYAVKVWWDRDRQNGLQANERVVTVFVPWID